MQAVSRCRLSRGGDDNGSGLWRVGRDSSSVFQEPVSGGLRLLDHVEQHRDHARRLREHASRRLCFCRLRKMVFRPAWAATISRDGTKMVSSLVDRTMDRLVFIATYAPRRRAFDAQWLGPASTANQIQFASFSPAGDRFVCGLRRRPPLADRNKLWMQRHHWTASRVSRSSLTYEPTIPTGRRAVTLSPIARLAFTRPRSDRFNCGIDIVKKSGSAWGQPTSVVPIVASKNR